MPVRLTTDDWEGVHANARHVDDPAWSDVEAAVRALNGRNHTQVVVQRDDGSNISVGGGDGRYNVCITTDDDRFLTVVDREREDGIEELVAGGQLGEYPAQTVVGPEPTLRAVKTFFENGTADDGIDWLEE